MGVGIYKNQGCTLTVADCAIAGAPAAYGAGGVDNDTCATLVIRGCTIGDDSSRSSNGGGTCNDGMAVGLGGTVQLLIKQRSLGTATVVDGVAMLTVKSAGVRRAIAVVYSGDRNDLPGSSSPSESKRSILHGFFCRTGIDRDRAPVEGLTRRGGMTINGPIDPTTIAWATAGDQARSGQGCRRRTARRSSSPGGSYSCCGCRPAGPSPG